MTKLHTISVLALVSLGASSASAALYNLSGVINSSQEVPSNGSLATGNIIGTYDDVSNLLTWDISWTGLSGPATGIHFHGPANPGTNAGVQVNIGTNSGLTSPTVGDEVISAAQGADLLNGLWYVNIHTSAFPSGEIRGQVNAIPEPTSALLLGLAGILGFRRRR